MKSDWRSSGIPFYRTREIVNLAVNGTVQNDLFISSELYNEMKDKYGIPQQGDLMLTAVGTIGIPYVVGKSDLFYYKDASVLCLTNTNKLNSEFFKYLFYSSYLRKQIFSASKGTTVDTITIEKAAAYTILLPPVNEQGRIVKELRYILSIIDCCEKNLSDVRDLVNVSKSKILELAMRGKLVPQDPSDEPAADMLRRINPKAQIITDTPHSWNIPEKWCWCQLGDLFNHNTGKALNSANTEGKEYKYITTSNVYWNRFELRSLKKMLYTDAEVDKCRVERGDLLVCEGGDVGRAAIWDMEYPIMIQNHLHKLRPLSDNIFPAFFLHVFKLYKVKNLIGGKGIALQGFSSNALHKLVVPCPPSNEQRRIVAKIEELYAVLDKIEASLQA